jgi:hypothetical protein
MRGFRLSEKRHQNSLEAGADQAKFAGARGLERGGIGDQV